MSKKIVRTITIIKPLNIKAEKCSSLYSIQKGFMFYSKRNAKAKLFILPIELPAGIHLLFVFFPIIVLWLNQNKKVTACSLARPFFFYNIHKAKYVLEIPYTLKTKKFLYLKNKQLKWR